LGGGVTGLATGATVLEAATAPGGMCASYAVGGYRFEPGGGHWIFGGEPDVLALLDACSPLSWHERRAAAYFADTDELVPYPVQGSAPLGDATGARTMADWLHMRFGPALCERFFFPFHERYTAGLYTEIAPQDAYKSPGAGPGYNAHFAYPAAGLMAMVAGLAARADVRYRAEVVGIDTDAQRVICADGRTFDYERIVSTLPLPVTLALAGVTVDAPADPYTSVLVLNIGAQRGSKCPDEHWIYMPRSGAGFHRVGIYSNVDRGFAPADDRVALYVERAFRPGVAPEPGYTAAVVTELQELGYIGDVDVVDESRIEFAYTWQWPDSTWVADACAALRAAGVEPVGRYAEWRFQGIAESVRNGLDVS
jgi:protoporphyrinogen oxidase